jgi:hypothetical protein
VWGGGGVGAVPIGAGAVAQDALPEGPPGHWQPLPGHWLRPSH